MSETTPNFHFSSIQPESSPAKPAARNKKAVAVQAVAAAAPSIQAAPLSEADAMLALIERAARDATLDLDRMERIFKLREDMLNRQSLVAYNEAMAKAQAEVEPVVRNKENSHTRSKYADLAAIAEIALPVIHANGFGLSFSEFRSPESNCIGVACEVTHAGGHVKRYEFNVPSDGAGSQGKVNKTSIQAYGSTFTYGRRYATCSIFNIAITDDDGNRQRQAPADDTLISDEQEMALRDKIESVDADQKKFCAYFRIAKLADLKAADLGRAMAALDKKASAR